LLFYQKRCHLQIIDTLAYECQKYYILAIF
jgi:hypothetical protein